MSLKIEDLSYSLKVIEKIQETPDAVSLVLEIPVDLKPRFQYRAGQFVTFFLNLNGETLARSYSLSSAPEVDRDFKITVKKVPGGRGSNYLCDRVGKGDHLLTTPPSGHFFRSSPPAKTVFLFAAGSGITPVFSILKSLLKTQMETSVTLIFANRTEADIIYAQELDRWAQNFPQRLRLQHVLTQPSPSWAGARGRLNAQKINELVQREPSADFYLCGPVAFMTTVRDGLLAAGINPEQVRSEDFATAVHKPGPQVHHSWTLIGPDAGKPAEEAQRIIAEINGEIFEAEAKPDVSVLESLISAGAQPPYSCMDGACMACLAKVQEGQVYQEDPGILNDDNVRSCETLTCQAKPLAKVVRITYDNL